MLLGFSNETAQSTRKNCIYLQNIYINFDSQSINVLVERVRVCFPKLSDRELTKALSTFKICLCTNQFL